MEMFNSISIVSALLLLVTLVAYWYISIPRGLPPGPIGLPFVGYFPFLRKRTARQMTELSKKHGNIMSMYVGNRLLVVLNSMEALKDAFLKQANTFSERPLNFELASKDAKITKTYKSLPMRNGRNFELHSQFAQKVFRNCGLGKNSLGPVMMNEIQSFISALKEKNGAPCDFRDLLYASVSNNILLMLLGRRLDYGNSWLSEFFKNTDHITSSIDSLSVFNCFPWLKRFRSIISFFGKKDSTKAYIKGMAMIKNLLSEQNAENTSRDNEYYCSAFRSEQKLRKISNPEDTNFSEETLISFFQTLLLAGSESTFTKLLMFLKYMMIHQDVQAKIQREIDDVIGREQAPTYQNHYMTPYTMAAIQEMLRLESPLNIILPRRNNEACFIQGYFIPKDTMVVANYWAIHYDTKTFPDPTKFKPERFLDSNGEFVRTENFAAFGIGKRRCLGEPLARMELYLYVVAMLQAFTFHPPVGEEVSFEKTDCILSKSKTFVTRALFRQ